MISPYHVNPPKVMEGPAGEPLISGRPGDCEALLGPGSGLLPGAFTVGQKPGPKERLSPAWRVCRCPSEYCLQPPIPFYRVGLEPEAPETARQPQTRVEISFETPFERGSDICVVRFQATQPDRRGGP